MPNKRRFSPFKHSLQKEDEAKFAEAIDLRDKGRYSEALILVEQLLSKYTKDPTLLLIAAHLSWELGALEKAVSYFRTAAGVSPQLENASLGLFHCLWEMGNQVEALDEAKRFMTVAHSKEYEDIVRDIVREINGEGQR